MSSIIRKIKQWLTEKDVAVITGLSLSTLQKHRFKRVGIPYSKVGRAVRYSLDDVESYMQKHRISNEEE